MLWFFRKEAIPDHTGDKLPEKSGSTEASDLKKEKGHNINVGIRKTF